MMKPLRLLRTGVAEIRRGNYRRPVEWLISERLLADYFRIDRPDQAPPSWITADGPLIVSRNLGTDRHLDETDYPCFEVSEWPSTFSIRPPHPVDRIDFHIVDTEPLERLSVKARLKMIDGGTETVEKIFTSGNFFEEPVLPVSIQRSQPFEIADLEVAARSTGREGRIDSIIGDRLAPDEEIKYDDRPQVSLPAPRTNGHPIFLISIDTFRYDFLDAFAPLLDALGGDATIPAEPRTQGTWTRPSHAAMLTGTHPLNNGVFGYLPKRGKIRESCRTLPELLTEHGYKCSGITTSPHLSARDGFARGFHRYEQRPMAWKQRRNDASDVVDQTIRWIDQDDLDEYGQGFYFLHIFDAHYPYIPPYPSESRDLDLGMLDRFDQLDKEVNGYIEVFNGPERSIPDDELNSILSLYHHSLRYVARQIRRLLVYLKDLGVYEDAFIVITGDHGEEFFERKFCRHESVNDANVRIGTVIKPPAGSGIQVPDQTDTIDILPTVVEFVGGDVPATCDGQPWQSATTKRTRYVERFGRGWYVLGVERDGIKGIFTYKKNGRERPSATQLEEGPVQTEFYDLEAVRLGNYVDCRENVSGDLLDELRTAAEEFITSKPKAADKPESEETSPSERVMSRLEELGYT